MSNNQDFTAHFQRENYYIEPPATSNTIFDQKQQKIEA
jgi:hypothetical protein